MSTKSYRKMRTRALCAEERVWFILGLLEEKMPFSWCFYCLDEFATGETQKDAREKIEAHVKVCPKHPLREAEHEIRELKVELARLNGG